MPPSAPQPSRETTRRRERAVRLTVTASFGAKAVSVLCTLAQVPLALHALGTEAYGLWITLFSVMVMINLADFGLGVAMQKAMAEAFARDDSDRLRRVFVTGAAALGLLALLILSLGLPLTALVEWHERLHLTDPTLRGQAAPALAIALVACAVGLPLNAAARLAAATQRGWMHAGWIAAGSAATLAVVAWSARAAWGFIPFVAVTLLLPAGQSLGLAAHLWRSLGWKWSGAALLPRSEWRARLGESLSFAAPQISLLAAQTAPPLALALVAGPTAATAFNVLQRLFGPIAQGQIIFLTPLWPAFTEAHTRGDTAWVRRAFHRSLLVTLAGAFALALLAWQAAPVLRWWLGPTAPPPGNLFVWLVAAWSIAQMLWLPPLYLLMGVGHPADLRRWGTLGPLFSLAGLTALAATGDFGAAGIVLGATAGLAGLGLPGLVQTALARLRALSTPSPRP